MVTGRKACNGKSNEITAIPVRLDAEGDTITIDAVGCRTAIAEKIREKKARYILPVKANRPALYNDIQDYFDPAGESRERNPPSGVGRSGAGKKNRGRIESRKVLAEENLDRQSGRDKRKDLKSIILYRGKCAEGDKTAVSARYYISSLASDALDATKMFMPTSADGENLRGCDEFRIPVKDKTGSDSSESSAPSFASEPEKGPDTGDPESEDAMY